MTSKPNTDSTKTGHVDIPPVTDALIERYFHGSSTHDVSGSGKSSKQKIVTEHFRFSTVRLGTQSLIRIYDVAAADPEATDCSVLEIVTEDIPFLVDSVSMALDRHNIRLLLRIHPVFNVRRTADGQLIELEPSAQPVSGYQRESFMRFQVETLIDENQKLEIEKVIHRVLKDVMATSRDRQSIQARVIELLSTIGSNEDELGARSSQYIDRDEMAAFLRWVLADHFVFLGYLNFESATGQWHARHNSGLGILSGASAERLARLVPLNRSMSDDEESIHITQAVERSRVHQDVWIDVIVVTTKEGDRLVRHAIVGLFTSIAYGLRPEAIPYLRSKVDFVMRASDLPVGGFGYRTLRDVLTYYPRSQMFQTEPGLLLKHSQEILQIQTRPRTHVLLRYDPDRDVDVCIVYLQRDRFSRETRMEIEVYLRNAFATERIFSETHMDTSSLAYVYFLIHAATNRPEPDEVQQNVAEITTQWTQHVATSLKARGFGTEIIRKFSDGFPTAYRERFSAADAAADAIRIDQALAEDRVGIYVYDNDISGSAGLGLRLYSPGSAISLSAILPPIENLGFEVGVERPYEVQCDGDGVVWLHDFSVRARSGEHLDSVADYRRIEHALERMWIGDAENDRFNQLVLFAQLDWREASLIRGLCRYMRQIPISYGENYIIDALVRNPEIVSQIVQFFYSRFDPDHEDSAGRDEASESIATLILEQLDSVQSLDEDRILRTLFDVTSAIVRTNYFQSPAQRDSETLKNVLAFKFESSAIQALPLPRPLYEIFVYSPRFEGIHLRAGSVARGGLRWSDRREDFRTEVLGLMKAQVVKNAVIVPVGSKGGFIVRKSFEQPAKFDRDQLIREVVICYQAFIGHMLAITDNLVNGVVVAPERVIRRDANDPYLVVAADKGTATFSDLANEVSREHGFWLDDAFASGGRTGYDHKVMGITARGAWESVKRHFRGLGVDVQQQPFRVIGIGDMSGDVFGNGMLLSRKICLNAAFNHRHIFIDPEPDPEISWQERHRLFALPRSGWDDYDPTLISTGGGVYERTAKSIKLNEETRSLLNSDATELSPNELINLLLKTPTDLLWNGGIGTYVKSRDETHEDAADRSSDALRVDGHELGARVVGEGGNLGMTQLGRIEFCQSGGNCYTDFVDNAAGVHSSDYEVNIKILLNAVVARGELDETARNELLLSMTDEVAGLVLRENYRQTRSLAYATHYNRRLFQEQVRLLRSLEASGRLDRQVEHLPDGESLIERNIAESGFSAPEIAVLQAYAKMELYDELLASRLPDDPWLVNELVDYFPDALTERYRDDLWNHQLRRELVCTQITNQLIDATHASFVQRIRELSGASTAAIARAFILARELFDIDKKLNQVASLDSHIKSATQNELLKLLVKLLENATLQLLGQALETQQEFEQIVHGQAPEFDIESTLDRLRPGIGYFKNEFRDYLSQEQLTEFEEKTGELQRQDVPAKLADEFLELPLLANALEIINLSSETGREFSEVIQVYFESIDFLNLGLLGNFVDALVADSEWHIAAKSKLRQKLASEKHRLLVWVLKERYAINDKPDPTSLAEILGENANPIRSSIAGLSELAEVDFAICSVAVDRISQLKP